jgi:hypothetical protein
MNSHSTCFRGVATFILASRLLEPWIYSGRGAEPTLTLARDGKPTATIVVAKSAGHIPWFAAGDLQYHVRKITGATLPLVTDDAEVRGPRILVGASRQTEALGLHNAGQLSRDRAAGRHPLPPDRGDGVEVSRHGGTNRGVGEADRTSPSRRQHAGTAAARDHLHKQHLGRHARRPPEMGGEAEAVT